MPTTGTETTAPAVQVGDFFVASWGYDQTNVDFFKVIEITPSGKSVKVQKWQHATVDDDGGPITHVSAGGAPCTYVDWSGVDQDADYWTQQEQKVERPVAIETKRLQGGEHPYIRVYDFATASKWDGSPEYQTGSGWGH